MKRPKHIPSYIFLLSEYVGRLESLQLYRDKPIPAEVWESMQQRAKELKAIRIEHLDAEAIAKEISNAQSQIFIK